MPKENPYKPFTPRPEQMALVPDVTGNEINGLGETQRRRADMVYWAPNPDDIAHGEMQKWFYHADADTPEYVAAKEERTRVSSTPVDPLEGEPVERTPEEWRAELEAFAKTIECEKIAVTRMDPDWLYDGVERDWETVIVIAVHHDFSEISEAPMPRAGAEVIRQYGRAAYSAILTTSWLQRQGWAAEAVTGPMTGPLLLIPPALAAGLGELGKHGSVINPEFGSSFRLSAVMTNAPIPTDGPQDHGIDEFCMNCRICEEACPPEALSPDKQTVRGVEKWYVDFDKCLPFFNEHRGCSICIAVCPWSRPGVGFSLAEKLARRRQRLSGQE